MPREPATRHHTATIDGYGCADGRRQQHRHLLGLALVPVGNQPLSVFEDLRLKLTPCRGLLVGLRLRASFILRLLKPRTDYILRLGQPCNRLFSRSVTPITEPFAGGVKVIATETSFFEGERVMKKTVVEAFLERSPDHA